MRSNALQAHLFALLLGGASACSACSVPDPRTSRELVRDADAIVLARVVDGTPEHFGNPTWDSIEMLQFHDRQGPGPQVTFELVETLKGRAPGQRFNLVGSLKYFGPNTHKPPYDAVRPGGQRGMCFAYDYKLGGTFLLLLRNGTPYWSAVRPTNEEVSGPTDAWLRWVAAQLKRGRKPSATR